MTSCARGSYRFVHLFVVCAAAVLSVRGVRADVVPTNGMLITANTTFVPGTYNLSSGVSIGASNVTLDMHGATLVGSGFNNYGVQCRGYSHVTIKNGTVRGYYYGIRVENGTDITVQNNMLSGNYVDPSSLTNSPPFLNINVGPNLGDKTNLGGGLFANGVSYSMISGNTAENGENGLDLYSVTFSTISNNQASNNTGWGVHLYASTDNVVSGNSADNCIRTYLYDSTGFLLVMGSHRNQILNNSFRGSGDGIFMNNNNGCPCNDNLVQGNDGSNAGANAFESTFNTGDQFIGNIADGCNYGFWLGYSHDGNVIRGNSIQGNNVTGIEIEHGQYNTIEDNTIVGNGGWGIKLYTDGQIHFTPSQFPCLNLPNQTASSYYTIRNNLIYGNFGGGLQLTSTTNSVIYNNLFANNVGGTTATSDSASNVWTTTPTAGTNIVGGPTLGGNYWSNYAGSDTNADGLGDTLTPYTNGGQIAAPGDPHPLIGNPVLPTISNPLAFCDRGWRDLGRNTHADGSAFNTSNGTHFATDGTNLYLAEAGNGSAFDWFNPATGRYVPRVAIPEGVQDGGHLQYGNGVYYVTVGLGLTASTGDGNGTHMYYYTPATDTWAAAANCRIASKGYAHEAIAYDPVGQRLYATIASYQTGGDSASVRKLAIYNPATDQWTGFTAASTNTFSGHTEAECFEGRVYVWRGGGAGGAINGSDSYLDVYTIATNSWSRTPSLQDSGIILGFVSGGIDVWGVTISADPVARQLFVFGAENNHQVYVFDLATQRWAVTPNCPYDGGWGGSMEYVPASQTLYVIDGRNGGNTPQGSAALIHAQGDVNLDGHVGATDFQAFGAGMTGPDAGGVNAAYVRLDYDCDGAVDLRDFAAFQRAYTGP